MAHDFLGNELSVGDDVVFLNYNGTSASLERGKITRASEHTAEINGKRRAEYKIVKVGIGGRVFAKICLQSTA